MAAHGRVRGGAGSGGAVETEGRGGWDGWEAEREAEREEEQEQEA